MTAAPHSHSIQEWLKQFHAKYKRPPRILHIGNIANNAYINAKVMRRYGIEADVMSLNYYHIMGCPEWEDAEFEGEVGDDFLPDWSAVDLKGFKRPNWFVQGETVFVLNYFLAKNNNMRIKGKLLQKRIFFKNWQLCSVKKKSLMQQKAVAMLEYALNHFTYKNLFYRWPLKGIKIPLRYIRNVYRRSKSIPKRILSSINYSMRKMLKTALWIPKQIKPLKIILKKIRAVIISNNSKPVYTSINNTILSPIEPACSTVTANPVSEAVVSTYYIEQQNGSIQTVTISETDIASFAPHNALWKKVCAYYDIVQGYSIEGIYPLLAGHTPYTAYEHGTLREIPFQNDLQGRLCTHTYKNAAAVFVTNIDCLAAAKRLKIAPERIVPLPHAFDSQKAFDFIEKHKKTIKLLVEPVTFIAPARHHWLTGDTSWRKGNDAIIRAAKILHDQGLQFKVTFILWGKEIDKSQALINELNIAEHFEWVNPMRKNQLWLAYLSSAAILDQFVVPAMGGVGFETLGLGRRLITRLNMTVAAEFFGEAPPVYNAHTPEEVAAAMQQVIADPYDTLGVGDKAQQWVKQYHSGEAILVKQLQQYSEIIGV